ncbi:hypothetical protein BgiBS90_012672 [Biomphalaria glabrata]|nr:hypothetical protein BgiBS90_012672 [Biomphalaria glabrata]
MRALSYVEVTTWPNSFVLDPSASLYGHQEVIETKASIEIPFVNVSFVLTFCFRIDKSRPSRQDKKTSAS